MTVVNQNNSLLIELINKQRKDVPTENKLYLPDIKRVCKNIDKDIFGDECCLWNGYITNVNKKYKGTYINFYFKHKKVALHRLLYINYIDDLGKDEYLKFTCPNKGSCCNVNHLKKFKYNRKKKITEKKKENVKIIKNENENKLLIIF